MNKLSFLLLTAVIAMIGFSCQPEIDYNFKLTATITGAGENMAYLQQRRDGEWVKSDSANFVGDEVIFSGNVDSPEFFYVTVKDVRGYVPVFIEKGEISLTSNVNNLRDIVVTGSESQIEYDNFMKSLATFDEEGAKIGELYQQAKTEGDEETLVQLEADYMALEEAKSESMLTYAKTNTESVVAAFIVMSNSYMFELDQLDEVVSTFSDKISNSYYVVYLTERVNLLKSVAIGQKFVDFSLNDPEGNPIPLSSVTGTNYILVDFWASWCGPCRAENPNVVEAYNKFHDKGFDVFGVSFDKDHDKWVEAVEKDGLTWPQVSDLKFWACEAGKLYGVQSIPHNVLLNPEGIIIEKNLRGQDLQDKLAEILGE